METPQGSEDHLAPEKEEEERKLFQVYSSNDREQQDKSGCSDNEDEVDPEKID